MTNHAEQKREVEKKIREPTTVEERKKSEFVNSVEEFIVFCIRAQRRSLLISRFLCIDKFLSYL
jgi:hypothetical protein